jgi:hypothetical protein
MDTTRRRKQKYSFGKPPRPPKLPIAKQTRAPRQKPVNPPVKELVTTAVKPSLLTEYDALLGQSAPENADVMRAIRFVQKARSSKLKTWQKAVIAGSAVAGAYLGYRYRSNLAKNLQNLHDKTRDAINAYNRTTSEVVQTLVENAPLNPIEPINTEGNTLIMREYQKTAEGLRNSIQSTKRFFGDFSSILRGKVKFSDVSQADYYDRLSDTFQHILTEYQLEKPDDVETRTQLATNIAGIKKHSLELRSNTLTQENANKLSKLVNDSYGIIALKNIPVSEALLDESEEQGRRILNGLRKAKMDLESSSMGRSLFEEQIAKLNTEIASLKTQIETVGNTAKSIDPNAIVQSSLNDYSDKMNSYVSDVKLTGAKLEAEYQGIIAKYKLEFDGLRKVMLAFIPKDFQKEYTDENGNFDLTKAQKFLDDSKGFISKYKNVQSELKAMQDKLDKNLIVTEEAKQLNLSSQELMSKTEALIKLMRDNFDNLDADTTSMLGLMEMDKDGKPVQNGFVSQLKLLREAHMQLQTQFNAAKASIEKTTADKIAVFQTEMDKFSDEMNLARQYNSAIRKSFRGLFQSMNEDFIFADEIVIDGKQITTLHADYLKKLYAIVEDMKETVKASKKLVSDQFINQEQFDEYKRIVTHHNTLLTASKENVKDIVKGVNVSIESLNKNINSLHKVQTKLEDLGKTITTEANFRNDLLHMKKQMSTVEKLYVDISFALTKPPGEVGNLPSSVPQPPLSKAEQDKLRKQEKEKRAADAFREATDRVQKSLQIPNALTAPKDTGTAAGPSMSKPTAQPLVQNVGFTIPSSSNLPAALSAFQQEKLKEDTSRGGIYDPIDADNIEDDYYTVVSPAVREMREINTRNAVINSKTDLDRIIEDNTQIVNELTEDMKEINTTVSSEPTPDTSLLAYENAQSLSSQVVASTTRIITALQNYRGLKRAYGEIESANPSPIRKKIYKPNQEIINRRNRAKKLFEMQMTQPQIDRRIKKRYESSRLEAI